MRRTAARSAFAEDSDDPFALGGLRRAVIGMENHAPDEDVGARTRVAARIGAGLEMLGYRQLPVSDLPTIDYPVISVSASLPGASPETMASAVAAPLEKQLSAISGLETMTSSSAQGSRRSAITGMPSSRPIRTAALIPSKGAAVTNTRRTPCLLAALIPISQT